MFVFIECNEDSDLYGLVRGYILCTHYYRFSGDYVNDFMDVLKKFS